VPSLSCLWESVLIGSLCDNSFGRDFDGSEFDTREYVDMEDVEAREYEDFEDLA